LPFTAHGYGKKERRAIMDLQEALKILSTPRDGFELCDVKFFLGDKRNITQEELAIEAAKGVLELNKGKLKAVASVDGDITQTALPAT
jgi:hypothetical protein